MQSKESRHPIDKLRSYWLFSLLFVGMWTLIGLSFSALYYASAAAENRRVSVYFALSMNLTRFYVWALLSLIVYRVATKFPIRVRPFAYTNLLSNILSVLIFAVIHQSVFMFIGWEMDPTFKTRFATFKDFYQVVFLTGLYLDILLALLIVIAQHAFIFYRNYRDGEVQQSLLKTQLAQAQLQALKMQLHPHFLFNALHSISALVLEDPPRANLMISSLGDFLRLTLEQSEATVPLREELEFLRCYLEIEQIRFEDRLTVRFDIDQTALNATVPHLILQPLVENAIRHVVATRSQATEIEVRARVFDHLLRLEVTDNGPGIQSGVNVGIGVGLENVRARLKQTYGSLSRFEIVNGSDCGLTVVLEIPLEGPGDRN
jgi:signal transduction histidine kinase